MGLDIDRNRFTQSDYDRYALRLQQSLAALEILLERPGFGVGPASLGAEFEFCLVDDRGHPLPVNRRVLQESLDPHLQLELDRFNLEYNLSPVPPHGRPFSAMQAELESAIASIDTVAARHGGQLVATGIVPTLQHDDLKNDSLSDLNRYRALQAGLGRLRQAPIQINISGEDHLVTTSDSVTLEGANTSFQIHLRVNPGDFARYFNAAQLVTPLVLAVGANSPIFLGHLLWDETRIALFKQVLDSRSPGAVEWRRTPRVPFGHGWVRRGALELFAEAVALFPPVMPLARDDDPETVARRGGLPDLFELRLHQGTIWQWNRPVFDPALGGHLRIEMRSLPSGPTPLDMLASAAFLVGLVAGMADEIDHLLPTFPFQYAEYNFYRAAQHGLDAQLVWPSLEPVSPREHSVRQLIGEMLPVAARGLGRIGVDHEEATRLLRVIRERLKTLTTGARWQRRMLDKLEQAGLERDDALVALVGAYLREAHTGKPVHEWSEQV